MTEARDNTEGGETGEQVGVRVPRAPWQRPSVRKLQTDQAELSVTHGAPDGTFTTS